jgi:hypothetical protein
VNKVQASRCGKQTYERRNDATNDERNNICPSRQGDVILQDDDETESEAGNEDDHVPPPRRLLVVFDHVLVVTVVEHTFACVFVRCVYALTPEQDDMS